jgi:hypothetical protein
VFTVHTKTSPQRVTITKQVSEPELVVSGRFVDAGTVELVAKRARDVRVTRVVHYGAASFEAAHSHLFFEILEIPVGLALMLIPAVWESPRWVKESESTKFVLHTNWLVALANPAQTATAPKIRAVPGSNAEVFADPPATREFRVSLPAPNLALTYRALDDAERPLTTGTVTTDVFGRASVPEVAGAIAFEITVATALVVGTALLATPGIACGAAIVVRFPTWEWILVEGLSAVFLLATLLGGLGFLLGTLVPPTFLRRALRAGSILLLGLSVAPAMLVTVLLLALRALGG